MKDVIAIGSTTRDVFMETNFEIAKWPSAPLKKALIIPFGEKTGAECATFTTGGNAANASVTFARQGLHAGVFTKIGEDVSGNEVCSMWKREGIDYRLVEKSKLPTSYSVLLLQKGERSIITYHGAADEFNLKNIDSKKLKSKWLYVSLSGDSYKSFDKLLAIANKNNIKVALNPTYNHLEGIGLGKLRKQLKKISFLVVNNEEAKIIAGINSGNEREIFKKLDEIVPGVIAITYGSKGVSVSDGSYIYKAGVFKNKKIIDRTGAGDAFGSGFVAGLIQKKEDCVKGVCITDNIEYAIRLGSANATSVVEQLGAIDGILTKKEFDNNKRYKSLKISISKVKK